MRAIGITGRGEPPAVVELADPKPGPGEVRVAVQAASVNGFDVAVAAGYVWDALPHEFPVVLGRDVVGTVESVGEGVDGPPVGGRVAGAIAGVGLGPHGTLGELVTMAAVDLAPVPDGVPSVQAAALGLAAVTALDVVTALEVGADDVVLVSGATGGVGTYVVQLAAQRGARVIATATPGAGADLVRALGAAATVDHSSDLGSAVRELAPDGVTKVAHAAGDAKQLGGLLAAGGRLVSLLGADQETVGRDDVAVTALLAQSSGPKLASLLDAVAAGTLTVPEPRSYPMALVAEALDAFAAGKLGKIVVTVP